MSSAQESRIPRIFEAAPDFEAQSPHGPIRLRAYTAKGKYVMLFSHPADFTPVCSTEFIALAYAWQRFEGLGVQLIGVSIDSVYSHIAWVRDLEMTAGIEVQFPVIADLDQKVETWYLSKKELAARQAVSPLVRGFD
jgi:peroxiredoxin (alkyl hydroperoxide reductase subunit C)